MQTGLFIVVLESAPVKWDEFHRKGSKTTNERRVGPRKHETEGCSIARKRSAIFFNFITSESRIDVNKKYIKVLIHDSSNLLF